VAMRATTSHTCSRGFYNLHWQPLRLCPLHLCSAILAVALCLCFLCFIATTELFAATLIM
jgi:hypothetical protein